jgi:hypothetical protein
MGTKAEFRDYLSLVSAAIVQGDAREESFYPHLAALLGSWAANSGRAGIHVTPQPKPTEVGNPDFRVWDGRQRIVGYVEAKAPTTENLEVVAESEQLRRYRHTFPNLILTNFFEFRLYRNGHLVARARLARPFVATKLGTRPPLEEVEELERLLEQFFAFSLPKAYSAESLATELAVRTRFLRDQVVAQELAEEQKTAQGHLLGFYQAFQKHLIAGLTLEDFADLYAQTITYGLFAARVRAGAEFNRRVAFDAIPHTIGILRDLFRFISLGDLPKPLEWIVDDIAEVLAVADVHGVLHQFFHEGKGADPIVHFYETFLAKYDPAERERRGVYYTPEPVVSYIVRSLHEILKTKFGKADGLASPGVTLLDPAAGTMTFVAKAAQVAVDEFVEKYGEGSRASFIKDHILENFYAFELMMAPYAVGHLKMAFFLEELGYALGPEERFKLYLTNTLEMEELAESQLPGFASLAAESHRAGEVKRDVPILVILGNPPYSVRASNQGPWISGLVDDYKRVNGKAIEERRIGVLQDDYVRFLRFAEWKIAQAGQGVVGMITNHSYLDNPTFRGMRQHLMSTFDEIYVLDLHGNSLKRERCPDGSPDENVFDIQQGVAIALFIKCSIGASPRRSPRVFQAERWGARSQKYGWLLEHDVGSTEWQALTPESAFYLLVPRQDAFRSEYTGFVPVRTIFPLSSVGVLTRKDKLAIQWSPESVWSTVVTFANMDPELARQGYDLGEDTRNWRVADAQADIKATGPDRKNVVPILYRAFDIRYTYYTGKTSGLHSRPCREVMQHMLAGENMALLVSRQVVSDFRHAFVSGHVTNFNNIDTAGRFGSGYHFPLHLYSNPDRQALLAQQASSTRKPNLNPKLVKALERAHACEPTPENIFHYVYAVLYAPPYRKKYAEFLRIDFPRIPFTSDRGLFTQLAELGGRLVDLHLLRSSELDPPIARFQGEGDVKVVASGKRGLRYDAERQRVYINADQHFEGVPPEVWAYQIGGYQVCHKWLKDRKSRKLTLDEIRTYCRIATALAKTIEIQKEIDALYPAVEENLLSHLGAG